LDFSALVSPVVENGHQSLQERLHGETSAPYIAPRTMSYLKKGNISLTSTPNGVKHLSGYWSRMILPHSDPTCFLWGHNKAASPRRRPAALQVLCNPPRWKFKRGER